MNKGTRKFIYGFLHFIIGIWAFISMEQTINLEDWRNFKFVHYVGYICSMVTLIHGLNIMKSTTKTD